jgi:hypothetical protein
VHSHYDTGCTIQRRPATGIYLMRKDGGARITTATENFLQTHNIKHYIRHIFYDALHLTNSTTIRSNINNNTITTASTLWDGRSMFDSQKEQKISLFCRNLDRLWGQPSLLFNRYCEVAAGPGRAGPGPSPPSMPEIKNEWSCTSTPLYAFMEWTGTFTFL